MSDDLREKLEAGSFESGANDVVLLDQAKRVCREHYEPIVAELRAENNALCASREYWATKRSDEISLDLAALRAENDALRDLIRFMDSLRDKNDGNGYVVYEVGSGTMTTHDAWPDPFPELLASVLAGSGTDGDA